MKIEVRPAKLSDIKTLNEFQNRLAIYERPFSPTIKRKGKIKYYNIKKMILSKKVLLLAVQYGNDIVGSCFGEICNNEHWSAHKKSGYIGMMFVKKGYRSEGVGKLLMSAIIKWLKSKRIMDIRLKVYDKNTVAVRFYRKYGFKNHILEMIY